MVPIYTSVVHPNDNQTLTPTSYQSLLFPLSPPLQSIKMEMMKVRVPLDISPGMEFRIRVGQQIMAVDCPEGAVPGSMIDIAIPGPGEYGKQQEEEGEGEDDPSDVGRPIWKSGLLRRVSEKTFCLSEDRRDWVRRCIVDARREIDKREVEIKASLAEMYVHAPSFQV